MLAPLAVVTQPENPALRTELTAFMRRWERNFERENADALGAMLAPDACSVDLDGDRMTAAESDRAARNFFKESKHIRVNLSIHHVQGSFEDAVVWSSATVSWTQKLGRRWVSRHWTGHYADSIRNTPDGWKFYYSQELPTIGR